MASFHINSKGEAGECHATISCPFGDESQHFTSQDAARKAFEESMEQREIERAETLQKLKSVQRELADFHGENPYPSPADPRLKEIQSRYVELDAQRARKEYGIPEDWSIKQSYNGGAAFIPPAILKRGPNGQLLQIATKRPDGKTLDEFPKDALYVQTSAGFYVSGPYSTVEEASTGLGSYRGSTGTGIIGHD